MASSLRWPYSSHYALEDPAKTLRQSHLSLGLELVRLLPGALFGDAVVIVDPVVRRPVLRPGTRLLALAAMQILANAQWQQKTPCLWVLTVYIGTSYE